MTKDPELERQLDEMWNTERTALRNCREQEPAPQGQPLTADNLEMMAMPAAGPVEPGPYTRTTPAPPGAYHTNATSTRMRRVHKTPLPVLGADLRMANKPGQDFASQDATSRPSSEAEPTNSTVPPMEDEDDDEEPLNDLTVATPVLEELMKDLQQAQEYDPEAASRRSFKSTRSAASSHGSSVGDVAVTSDKSRFAYVGAGVLMMLIVSITLALVFSLAKDTSSTGSSDDAPAMVPTLPPTSMESQVLSMLPSSTQDLIQQDPNSPQAQAYQWLMEDPSLDLFSAERIVQRFALATVFHSTGGFNWYNSSQWLSYQVHECQWYSRTSFAMKDFRKIEIPGFLTEIPDDYHKCDRKGILQHLWLDANNLAGTLPEELYLLTSLKSLSLGLHAELSGTISTSVGLLTGLEGLALYYCPHRGTIPTEIGLLTNLKALGINDNGHTGTIPWESFQTLTNLQTSVLSRNHLTGTIPTFLHTHFKKLKWLMVDENNLEGPIPSEMGLISSLEWLVVGGNQLSGTIPTQLVQLPKLLMLTLFQNRLQGTLPTQLGLMTTMSLLNFRGNQFTGTIPTEYGQLTDLTLTLSFLNNPGLVGTIPTQLGLLTKLHRFGCRNNNHVGQIPSQLGRLTHLMELDMDNNSFSGSIPTQLSALSLLSTMNIRGNTLLSGIVPEALCHVNATCKGTSVAHCTLAPGLHMDCTDLLCGCGCPCSGAEGANATAPSTGGIP